MLNIVNKMTARQNDNWNNPGVSIAFLGDSVTQGCFELYMKTKDEIETYFDKNGAYHNYLAKIFSVIYPNVPVNIINAGISGGNAPHGLERLDRDVLSYNPDLVVVCFGLNDSGGGLDNIGNYTDALDKIFKKIKDSGADVIFMTPNMMCTGISCHLKEPKFIEIAEGTTKTQNEGILEKYLDEAKNVCAKYNIPVCDCYAKWKQLYKCGVDINELLSNKINHPTREMNWLFAYSLAETIMSAE